jgi:hypothetical protein
MPKRALADLGSAATLGRNVTALAAMSAFADAFGSDRLRKALAAFDNVE